MTRNPDGSIRIPCRKRVRILSGRHSLTCRLEKGHTGKHERCGVQWEDGEDLTTCETVEIVQFKRGVIEITKFEKVEQ
jgi:hypothetical protein